MGKQTEKKNISSKKNYSFTGHRIIGDKKSNYINSNTNSESLEGSTTEEMMNILNSESKHNQSRINQMAMPGMNQMAMPGMNQMAMPGMNMMGAQSKMDDIDHLMVNTLVPLNNTSMNIDTNTLMNPTQMANNIGSISNLSKLSNNGLYGNLNEQNLTDQNMMSQFTNPLNQQSMGQFTNPLNQQSMNQFTNSNLFNLKNLTKL